MSDPESNAGRGKNLAKRHMGPRDGRVAERMATIIDRETKKGDPFS
jgi:hypothetical protein